MSAKAFSPLNGHMSKNKFVCIEISVFETRNIRKFQACFTLHKKKKKIAVEPLKGKGISENRYAKHIFLG